MVQPVREVSDLVECAVHLVDDGLLFVDDFLLFVGHISPSWVRPMS